MTLSAPIPTTMSAIGPATGGPESLALQTIPVPTPAPGEVLIRVAAAGVNGPDLMQRRGLYPAPDGHSPLLGLEVSGEIALPAGDWAVGDKVVALTNGGAYAEFVAVPVGQVLPAPANWSLVDAAALTETWFTITQTLVLRAGLAPGMRVLVTGAAGGLGGTAIQIARLLGADPIAVVSSDAKAAYALSLGARAVIRRDLEDVAARTLELTGGKGADRIIDMVGGEATRQHVEAAARFGHIIVVSTQADRNARLPLNRFVANQLTLSGSTLRHQPSATKAEIAATLRDRLWPALPGLIHPKIQHFALSEAAAAHRAMEDPAHFGKIVLVTAFGNR